MTCPGRSYALGGGDGMKKLLPALAVLAFTAGLLARPEAVSAAVREEIGRAHV